LKSILFCIFIVLCMLPVFGLEVSQSFVGEGQWSTSIGMGTTSTEMSGQGDMSYASQGSITDAGVILKSGLEFDGSKGRVKLQANLGNSIILSSSTRNASHISLRTKIDTASSEDTQDSTIGSLLLHSASINGQINGSIGEEISNGFYIGRPIDVSRLTGVGNFTINSTINLKEYQAGV
jgi:hypothetical protein